MLRLWLLDLDREPAPADARDPATSGERARSARFRRPRDGRRFLRRRAFLRKLLGAETGVAPHELMLATGPGGKPFLPGGPSFSTSHSDRWLLVGLCATGRLGVDLEVDVPVDEAPEIARAHFTERERAALEDEDPDAFLRLWTRKEALIKALGGGLSIPLDAFSVRAGRASGQALLEIDLPGERAENWHVASIPAGPGLHAAIAMDVPRPCVRFVTPTTAACAASERPGAAGPAPGARHATEPSTTLSIGVRRSASRATNNARLPR